MEWGIKLKNSIYLFFKKRFWYIVLKMFTYLVLIILFFVLFAKLINVLDFQWLYDKNSISYYRAIYFFDMLYYNGYVYIIIFTLAFVIFLILLYKEFMRFCSYINYIYECSDKFFDGSDDYVVLPEGMKDIEVKFNHFKSESIKRERILLESEKKKDDLIVYLAHDIRTPLTVVIGYLSLLNEIEDMPLEKKNKYIKLALDKSYRLEDLINELFDIARFNSEKIILEKEDVNLKLMIEQVILDFYPITKDMGKDIILNMDKDVCIYVDPDKMGRVFYNLINNAINYSSDNSGININVKVLDDNVYIDIVNKGKMIPKDKIDKIFDNFYRVDNSRNSKTGGSGLGLAISKQIIGAHGGDITVKSDRGNTTFTVVLPLI